MKPRKLFIIAGEPSGDVLGGKLMQALYERDNTIQFSGIGGERMKAQGLRSLFPMSELSIMGFAEIIPHIPHLLKRIDETVKTIIAQQPDAVVTIDSPGFCYRVAKKLREKNCRSKLIHYVAPTVWAYKPERAEKMAKLFDHLMVILPFEPPYFEKVGLPCSFVGHPIVEEAIRQGNKERFRGMYDIPETAPLLCVMAGSRKGEITRLMPIFAKTITNLAEEIADLHIVMPTVPSVANMVRKAAESLPVKTIVIEGLEHKFDAYAASNAALVKSGTATLEVAIAGVPMVVAYKVHPISAWMMRRMMMVKYVNIINILCDRHVIPECIQDSCTVTCLTEHIKQLFKEPDIRQQQLATSHEVLRQLGLGQSPLPSQRAAKVVLEQLS